MTTITFGGTVIIPVPVNTSGSSEPLPTPIAIFCLICLAITVLIMLRVSVELAWDEWKDFQRWRTHRRISREVAQYIKEQQAR